MSDYIKIRQASGVWTVRAGGAVIAETKHALALAEGSYPEVIYFPREDIAMAFLDKTDHKTTCPHKGEASYFSVVTKSKTIPNVGWSYENPKEAAAGIAGHIAFMQSDDVTVEEI